MELVVVTQVHQKMRELKEMFHTLPQFELLSLHHFADYQPSSVNGQGLRSQAIELAERAAQTLEHWVLADVSGLVVSALNRDNNLTDQPSFLLETQDPEEPERILASMRELTGFQRSAYLECNLALASPDGLLKCVSAICEGVISPLERGANGMGFDSIFIKQDYDKTLAELDISTKNRISHRRKAFDRLQATLENLNPVSTPLSSVRLSPNE